MSDIKAKLDKLAEVTEKLTKPQIQALPAETPASESQEITE